MAPKFIFFSSVGPNNTNPTVPKILSVNTDSANKTEKIIAHQNPGNRKGSKEKNDDEKPSANNASEKSKEDNDKIEISKKEQSEVISILNSTKIQTNWTEPDTIEFPTKHPNKNIDSKSKPKSVEFSPKIKSTEEGLKPGNNLRLFLTTLLPEIGSLKRMFLEAK